MGHFFPSYTFDLDNTIYLFTSGRYEYRNKGMDLFIEALHRLNQRLKDVPDPPTVVAFIITKAADAATSTSACCRTSRCSTTCATPATSSTEQMGQRLFNAAADGPDADVRANCCRDDVAGAAQACACTPGGPTASR